MCGIWGYAGETPASLDLITVAAKGASQRGPHSHGWMAGDVAAGLVHHQLGHVADCEACSKALPVARRMLGHSRLATVGQPDDPAGIQPFTLDGHWLVHNGNVYNWADLDPLAATDSRAILSVYAYLRADGREPVDALSRTLAVCDQQSWAVVVLDDDGTVLAHRNRLPLHLGLDPDGGRYLSSIPFPGSDLIPDGVLVEVAPELMQVGV